MKAFLHGQVISHTAYENKKLNKRLLELTKLISHLNSQYADKPSVQNPLLKQKLVLQSDYEILIIKKTEKLMARKS